MSLNLKNPRAYELACELSALTGESMTAVVITALEQRLEEHRKQKKYSELRKLIERFAAEMPPGASSTDVNDLYDEETGLPK
ncbi:MAG: type II toxin-antitoxin system VapB family antitoxin [Bryobacteraceae bacterium]|nr:type II toxin-antitoxin system VapB family antitoxin [Bryobacteraceae bacterium]